jgi:gas vesicle protein
LPLLLRHRFYAREGVELKRKVMDRNNLLMGALAGAAVGAIIGSFLPDNTADRLVDTTSRGVKDVSNRVSEYAKQNIPGMNRESQGSGTTTSSYQREASDVI